MQGHHSDHDEASSVHSDRVEIPDDDLVVQIFARLDGKAYNHALYRDAKVSLFGL